MVGDIINTLIAICAIVLFLGVLKISAVRYERKCERECEEARKKEYDDDEN